MRSTSSSTGHASNLASSSTSTPSLRAAATTSSDATGPSRAGRIELERQVSPLHVGLGGALLALTFVALRLAIAAHGDISRFVVAGTTFVDPARVPAGDGSLHVFPSAGYDG